METRAELDRGVTESTSEPILRGPKDSFTESHSKNLGLVRKRIKDPNLWFDEVKVGKRTETRVTIAYLNDVTDKNTVSEIKKILEAIDVDGILDSGNIKEYLLKEKSVFPQILSTERPDLVCQSILNGKIALIVENTPFVLILPNVFIDFMHTSEDQYQKPLNISFTRALKVFALIVTLFTPAIYIAITTFDQTAVPDKLLISLAVQRSGVPFPTFFEIILLMVIFEILREGDIRSPSNMGTSMSIVGALVLGQAAVDAGIVSPIAVIVIAITSICSLIFNDIDFMNGIRAWRFIFILAATFFGLIGLVAAGLVWLLKLSSLDFFAFSLSFFLFSRCFLTRLAESLSSPVNSCTCNNSISSALTYSIRFVLFKNNSVSFTSSTSSSITKAISSSKLSSTLSKYILLLFCKE